ncbi:GNAT family N-acetyltransferase [Adhaeribacter pallidiroseus]|nr:GNAT family N-acetyltransferase [Adhaeribacter pallidiroseus]
MAVTIKEATLADADQIAQLGRVTFAETFGKLFPAVILEKYLNHTFSPTKIRDSLQKPANYFLLADTSTGPVGYLKMKRFHAYHESESPDQQAQLQKIYVLQQFVGTGAGSALLQKCHETAQAEGFKELWLAVWHLNERALQFYRSHHYQFVQDSVLQIDSLSFKMNIMALHLAG